MKTHFLPLVGLVLLGSCMGLPTAVTTHSAVLALTITPKIEIAFPTASGNYYQVQWASPLNTNEWNNLGRHIDGNGLTNVVYDPVGFGQNRFYRVYVYD